MRFFSKYKRLLIWLILSALALYGIKYWTPTAHFNFDTPPKNSSLLLYEEFMAKQLAEEEFRIFPDDNCQPKRHVLFIKGHPKNPSNFLNLFYHYGDRDNLAITLVNMEEYYAELKKEFSLKIPLPLNPNHHSENLFSTRTSIPIVAAKQNYETMKSILPSDTIFLTDLTDTVSSTEFYFKRYSYGKSDQNASSSIELLEKFFLHDSEDPTNSNQKSSFKFRQNPISARLGFDEQHLSDSNSITKFTETIDSRFDLAMIEDRMDEFLVHLYHLLCWPLDDLIIFRHTLRNNHFSHKLPAKLADKIRSYNKVDELLYKHFNEKLTRRTKKFGKSKMTEGMSLLKKTIKSMYDKCLAKLSGYKNFNLSDILQNDYYTILSKFEYNLDRKCYELIRWESYIIMMPPER